MPKDRRENHGFAKSKPANDNLLKGIFEDFQPLAADVAGLSAARPVTPAEQASPAESVSPADSAPADSAAAEVAAEFADSELLASQTSEVEELCEVISDAPTAVGSTAFEQGLRDQGVEVEEPSIPDQTAVLTTSQQTGLDENWLQARHWLSRRPVVVDEKTEALRGWLLSKGFHFSDRLAYAIVLAALVFTLIFAAWALRGAAPGQSSTEFYQLSEPWTTDNPHPVSLGEPAVVMVVIHNSSSNPQAYWVEARAPGKTANENLHATPFTANENLAEGFTSNDPQLSGVAGPFLLRPNETIFASLEFRALTQGDQVPLKLFLFRGTNGKTPYRTLDLWLDVRR